MVLEVKIIGACLPSMTDSTSYYRGLGPLGQMCKESNLVVHVLDRYNWATLRQLSCLFMLRPFNKNHVEIFEEAKFNNIPVWIDYDDLLMDMPMSNPSYFTYQKKNTKAQIDFMVKNADVVTVSTQFLAQSLVHLNQNIVVLPNGVDIDAFPYRKINPAPRAKSFFWRGSPTHHKDVWSYADEIVSASEELQDWKFHFIADSLWFLTERMRDEQCYVMEGLPIERYHAHIWRINPSACIVPLHDHPFNRSKSNIAYLEAAFSGAMAIGPDWEEWRHPGVLLYTDQKSFREAMMVVARGEIDVQKINLEAWSYICENFDVKKINVRRRQVFERLIM